MCAMIQAAKITFAQWKCWTFQSIIYPAEEKKLIGRSSILAWGKSRVGLPLPFIAINTQRCNSCRRSKRCWSLCTCFRSLTSWRRCDSIICTFRIASSLIVGACYILEAELARRTACRVQVKQLKSVKLSPRSRGNRKDSNAWASTTLSWPLSTSISWNAKERHHINSLTGDQRLFAKSTMRLSLHFTLFSDRAKHCSFPVHFPRSCSRAKLIDR